MKKLFYKVLPSFAKNANPKCTFDEDEDKSACDCFTYDTYDRNERTCRHFHAGYNYNECHHWRSL